VLGAVDVPSVRRLLASLDASRAAAFAVRDPRRLGDVYASPSLLARDRALLLAIVPPGCGLTGVRTAYRAVRVLRRAGAGVDVGAEASVRTSRLVCHGERAGRARGTPPAALRIGLVRTRAGYRIASLQAATG
jgi:hypothetical protein